MDVDRAQTQSVQGRVALITGAAKGIGWGCAQVLGMAGAAVALVDIDANGVESAAQQLRGYGSRCHWKA